MVNHLVVAAKLRVGRLWIVGPEHRHSRARQNRQRALQPVQNPVGLQPFGRHAQIGGQRCRRLVLGDGAEHVALLALKLLEHLFAGTVARRRLDHLVCLARSDGIRDGAEVPDDAVQVRIVEAEGRHSHADPRAKRDRPAQKRIEPVGLHARAFRRQHRRPQR